jgi:hypothetical protein
MTILGIFGIRRGVSRYTVRLAAWRFTRANPEYL